MNTQLFYEAVEGYKADALGATGLQNSEYMTAFDGNNELSEDDMFTLADEPNKTIAENEAPNYNFTGAVESTEYKIDTFNYNYKINDVPIINIKDKSKLTPVLSDYVRFNNEIIEPAYRKQNSFNDVFEYMYFVEDYNYRYLLEDGELDLKKVVGDFMLTTYGVLATPEVYVELVNDDLDLVKALAFPFRQVNLEDYNVIKKYYKEDWFNVSLLHNACIRSNVTELMCQCMKLGADWNTLLEFIPLDATEPDAYKHALELALRGYTDLTDYKASVVNHTSRAFITNLDLAEKKSELSSSFAELSDAVVSALQPESENHVENPDSNFSLDLMADLIDVDATGEMNDILNVDVKANTTNDAPTLPEEVTVPETQETYSLTTGDKYREHPGYKWILKLLAKKSEEFIDNLLLQTYPAIRLVLLADHDVEIAISDDQNLSCYYDWLNQLAYSLDISALIKETPQQVCYKLLTTDAPLNIDFEGIVQSSSRTQKFVNAFTESYIKHWSSYKDFLFYWYALAKNPNFFHELNGTVTTVARFIRNRYVPSAKFDTTAIVKNIVVGYRVSKDSDYEVITAMDVYDAAMNLKFLDYLIEQGEPVRFDKAKGVLTIGDVPATQRYFKSSLSRWIDTQYQKTTKFTLEEIDSINTKQSLAMGVNSKILSGFQQAFKSNDFYTHALDCMLGAFEISDELKDIKNASTLGYLLVVLGKYAITRDITKTDILNALVSVCTTKKYNHAAYDIQHNYVSAENSITVIKARYIFEGKTYEWQTSFQEFVDSGCFNLFNCFYQNGVTKVNMSVYDDNKLLIDATIGGA